MNVAYGLPVVAIAILGVGVGMYLTPALSSSQTSSQTSSRSEVLVVQRNSSATASENAEAPTGGLYVLSESESPSGGEQLAFPLKHTEVNARVAGNLARVEVTQTFENPFDRPLEAVYVFPLPDEAAVDDMEIKIGDRIIKGDIKRREEAQRIYDEARAAGRTAGLLEQERANIFTQSLANIKPGEQIDVTIRYTESLSFEGGDYEFAFPMVVGPRYIPGTPITPEGDTDTVPDASRITPPVLKPDTRSGHDINVTVAIDAGLPVTDVRSTSHDIRVTNRGETVEVTLDEADTIPNKDLILRYQVAGKNTQATVLTQAGDRGGHFAVYLIPAVAYRDRDIVPKDVVFLVDTSGSQSGAPIEQSKALMRRFINGLNPNDTFAIIDFSNTAQSLSPAPLANTASNRQRALNYIDTFQGSGGTELLNGIRAVQNYPAPESGRLRSVVLLTDGYIGNDAEIIAEVQRHLKPGNRLYSIGVGSSVNRFLLDRLAEVGRGTMQVIRYDEQPDTVVERFFQQINNPVLTNIQVNWKGGGEAPTIYPSLAPDLFAQQPLVLFGRKEDKRDGELEIEGTLAGGETYRATLKVNFDGDGNSAIAQLWGRARIKDLMNQMYGGETTSGVEAVTQTALDYRLLSQYTAFVAVSEEVRVDPDGNPVRVEVPVELPDGVSYEGIFGADEEADMERYMMRAPSFPAAPRSLGAPAGIQNVQPLGSSDLSDYGETVGITPEDLPQPLIQVLEADGLDDGARQALEQHLAAIEPNLPDDLRGEMVLELQVENGRVRQVLLNDTESDIIDRTAFNLVKRSLLRWQLPDGVSGTVRLVLNLQT